MAKLALQHQSLVVAEQPLHGRDQSGPLLLQPTLSKGGEGLRIFGSSDQGFQHRSARFAHDVGGD